MKPIYITTTLVTISVIGGFTLMVGNSSFLPAIAMISYLSIRTPHNLVYLHHRYEDAWMHYRIFPSVFKNQLSLWERWCLDLLTSDHYAIDRLFLQTGVLMFLSSGVFWLLFFVAPEMPWVSKTTLILMPTFIWATFVFLRSFILSVWPNVSYPTNYPHYLLGKIDEIEKQTDWSEVYQAIAGESEEEKPE